MSFRDKFTGAVLSLGLVAACGVAAHAQQAAVIKAAPQAQVEGQGKDGRHHNRVPVWRIMSELTLTDAQEQQARAIVEKFKTSVESQRQALTELHRQKEQGGATDEIRAKAEALRAQIDEARKLMQGELLALLTPEQRTQYEQLETKWKSRRDEMRARRGRGEMQQDEQ
jgi:Spy/CpxP family protein refolding chaperone